MSKPNVEFYENQTDTINDCLFGTGYAGFGHVGVLAFDPSTLTARQRANSTQFWVSIIRTTIENTVSAGNCTSVPRRVSMPRPFRSIRLTGDVAQGMNAPNRTNRYEVGLAQGASYAVMTHLYNIAEMRPLSIWWVILLLGTLAILLGPVDYKLLKRFDRLPLTWLTCTFWIILFSVGAYYGVRALRGGKLQFRVVSVLDKIENNDLTWSTQYCGLFASHSDDYRFEGLNNNQWWSGIAPTEASIWAYNQNVASRRIYCLQHDGGNLPVSLPVNIWTLQCLMNESTIEQLPFHAEVQILGDEVTVNIVNESDSPIRSGYVLLANNRGIEFGAVPSQSDKQFRFPLRRLRVWEGFDTNRYRQFYRRSNYSMRFKNEDAFFAQGCLQRTQAIETYLAGGAAVVCAQYDQAPLPFAIKDQSCHYTHTQLARLVVFPKTPEGSYSP